MKTQRVLKRLSKYTNVRYRMNQVFLQFTINLQSKPKKFGTLTRFHGGFFQLEILEVFKTAFLLKTTIWIWLFFKYCRVLENLKIYPRKMQAAKKLLEIARDRRKTLKKEIEERKMRKSQAGKINIFLH